MTSRECASGRGRGAGASGFPIQLHGHPPHTQRHALDRRPVDPAATVPPVIAGVPEPPKVVPAAVRALSGGREPRAVWRNELDGFTFQLGAGPGRRFVKWQPAGTPIDLAAEAARLSWAGRFTPVPRVLELGADERGSWLLTPGKSIRLVDIMSIIGS